MERTANIEAPAEKVFAQIDDLEKWRNWSPFEETDPGMARKFSGAPKGKGAVYEWDSKNKGGTGRMEIIQSSSPSIVVIDLEFIKPFEAHNMAEFALRTDGKSTEVAWAMSGRRPYIVKMMHVFFDLDKVIGREFEKGLSKLKAICEE